MIPIEKVQDIISKHDNLEKDLSSGSVDPKNLQKNLKNTHLLVILYLLLELV